MRVVPAIDLRDGRCVRLVQGDFDRQTVYDEDPTLIAHRYRAAGFEQIHVVDLDGAQSGRQRHQEVVSDIVATTGLSVQLGGGIRRRETLAGWLGAGVSRGIVGSLAVTEPQTVAAWIADFGADRLGLALDVRPGEGDEPLLATNGWMRSAGLGLWECIEGFIGHGLRHVLCTDIDRDGTMAGPNLDLYREFRARYPDLCLQASGGVRHIDDLVALRTLGCSSAIVGRALLDGRIALRELASFLPAA